MSVADSPIEVPSKILSRRDIDFLLYEWLDAEELNSRSLFADHNRETFDAVLDLSELVAREHFYPINKLLDEHEPEFDGTAVRTPSELKEALGVFAETGMLLAGQPEDLGGMQLPYVVEKACSAYFSAASVAASGYAMLTIGNVNLLRAHASTEQIATWVPPMLAGRFFGTMCLSEPQAGSSLADVATRAEPARDGSYRLFGNKMWISGGDHDLAENIVHLVLAKIPGDDGRTIPGVKGISLFIVPKFLLDDKGNPGERNDVAVAGLNHKMGFRGTTNCLLNFGEGTHRPGGQEGAVGYLVGEPHRGLAIMFHMMNEARIGVGIGAVTLGYTGYLHALDYARNRPQGRPLGSRDPAEPPIPIVGHADVRRMLLAQKSYVEGGLALTLWCARLVDDAATAADPAERADAARLLDLLTPVAKSWPSQWCLAANDLAIQVMGGYGYTRDYNVEQFYRDNRLNPIHEGTHGIQALDLLGRKVRLEGGLALQVLAQRIAATIARTAEFAGDSEWSRYGTALAGWGKRFQASLVRLQDGANVERGLANASVFLEAFGHYVVAWQWLDQARCALAAIALGGGVEMPAGEFAFYNGKLQAARYFLRWELPRIGPMLDLLDELDATALEMRDEWF